MRFSVPGLKHYFPTFNDWGAKPSVGSIPNWAMQAMVPCVRLQVIAMPLVPIVGCSLPIWPGRPISPRWQVLQKSVRGLVRGIPEILQRQLPAAVEVVGVDGVGGVDR